MAETSVAIHVASGDRPNWTVLDAPDAVVSLAADDQAGSPLIIFADADCARAWLAAAAAALDLAVVEPG